MHSRAEYRERRKAWRLLTSQLVLALEQTRVDGRIDVLLHKVDAWGTVELLHTLSKSSLLQLFKLEKKHIKSSFYAVAERVQPHKVDALQAVVTWKELHIANFGSGKEYYENGLNRDVDDVLSSFGTKLIHLGRLN
ncbi:hypothetical protein CC78DRAFT_574716 [Lojkania enalia]|uniref:Uncharacterized protein n=1 Tax=Lojkania enalia TaxID=147567 RepID=A0A9P4TPZ4_9PLEO|nr:hypothetical protein CC78DRAFT_574716 [Didymosphaeria enalia]